MKKDEFKKFLNILLEGFVPFPLEIKEIEGTDEVGYSYREENKGQIYLNFDFPFIGLDQHEREIVLVGIACHELLHLLLTDFGYTTRLLSNIPDKDKECYMTVANLIEDPAIENHKHDSLSGFMIRCLKASIGYFFKQGGALGNPAVDTDAFNEWIHAMILFGDVGLLRGDFQFQEAENTFWDCLPVVGRIIEEPNARKRLEMCLTVFTMVQPLWEDHLQKGQSSQTALQNLLQNFGKGNSSSGSEASMPPMDGASSDDHAADPSDPDDGNTTASRQQKMIDAAKAVQAAKEKGDGNIRADTGSTCSDQNSPESVAGQSPAISAELRIDKDLLDCMRKVQEGVAAAQESNSTAQPQSQMHPRVSSPFYTGKYDQYTSEMSPCVGSESRQNAILRQPDVAATIPVLKNRFKRAFRRRDAEILYTTSGKVSIRRMSRGRPTASIFEKRREPGDTESMDILFMLDVTGSMTGSLNDLEKYMTVLLEALAPNRKVHVKVVTFKNTRPVYTHLNDDRWVNDKDLRIRISGLSAGGGTFLSHAIRYSGELIKSRHSRRKLVVILTDGDPDHDCYISQNGRADAKEDCALAVKEIRRYADVIGIGFYYGDQGREMFESIFKKDYLIADDLRVLVERLPYLIEKCIK